MSLSSSPAPSLPAFPTNPLAPPLHVFRDGQRTSIRWSYAAVMVVLHILCLAAIPFFTWTGLALMFVLLWVCGGLGITLCYHRLLTHRSFQTQKFVEYVLTIFGCLAWQGSPIRWVGTHRLHHKDSDHPGDPHSPTEGFGWAHILWVIYEAHPSLAPELAAKDLARDPVMRFLDRTWFYPQFLLAAGVFALGYLYGGWFYGVSWLGYGIILRIVLMYHGTWFVNSAAHTWGYRNFVTTDNSTNCWWVALVSFGEGWHNNHHAQQRSAAHGMRWYEFDITYLTIRAMELVGLARRVVRPHLPQS